MRKLITVSCIAFLTAAAAPATAAQTPAQDKAAKANVEKKICKRLPSTGSRLPNKACLTAKEWKQVQDEVSRP
jgi:hypothetical protein